MYQSVCDDCSTDSGIAYSSIYSSLIVSTRTQQLIILYCTCVPVSSSSLMIFFTSSGSGILIISVYRSLLLDGSLSLKEKGLPKNCPFLGHSELQLEIKHRTHTIGIQLIYNIYIYIYIYMQFGTVSVLCKCGNTYIIIILLYNT